MSKILVKHSQRLHKREERFDKLSVPKQSSCFTPLNFRQACYSTWSSGIQKQTNGLQQMQSTCSIQAIELWKATLIHHMTLKMTHYCKHRTQNKQSSEAASCIWNVHHCLNMLVCYIKGICPLQISLVGYMPRKNDVMWRSTSVMWRSTSKQCHWAQAVCRIHFYVESILNHASSPFCISLRCLRSFLERPIHWHWHYIKGFRLLHECCENTICLYCKQLLIAFI